MKKTIIYSVLLGAAVLAAANANAQISDKITASGAIIYQAADTVTTAMTVMNTKSVVFNNKTIINALNASDAFTNATAGALIPNNSWLTYDGSSVWVTNKNGTAFDLTSLVDGDSVPFATVSFTGGVSNGRYFNDPTKGGGREIDRDANIAVTIQDGAGTSIVISGLGTEKFVWGKANANTGDYVQTESFSVTGGGAASYQGNTSAISKGTVSGSGKGTLTLAN